MEQEGYYTLTKDDRVILYGAATMGTILLKKLQEKGYETECFFDQRADEIQTHCGLLVYRPEIYDQEKEKAVILLAVKNVFSHSQIAAKLLRLGYKKIIYRPFHALDGSGTKQEMELNERYGILTEDGNTQERMVLPLPTENIQRNQTDQGIIKKGSTVTAYVPVTMLFTDKKEGIAQLSVLFLKPHINFVKYLFGMDGGEKESYLKFCIQAAERTGNVKITDQWKENVIANRAEVFCNMHHMYQIKPSFFIDQAIQTEWNTKRNYFNLKSGKHRAAFLTAIGKNYLPVTMSLQDYQLYLNHMKEKKIRQFLTRQDEKGFSAPIEHPYFYEESCFGGSFWFVLLRTIMRYFNDWFYQGYGADVVKRIRMVVELPDQGFIRRFFMRMGCQVVLDRQDEDGKEAADCCYDCIVCTWQWRQEHEVYARYRFILADLSDQAEGEKIWSGLCQGKEKQLYLERQ